MHLDPCVQRVGHRITHHRRPVAIRRVRSLGLETLEPRAMLATFQGLGDAPGGTAFGSDAWDISGDGQVVVGSNGFRWTAAGGMTDIGPIAHATSYDGSTVVGGGCGVWTQVSGLTYLPGLPGGDDSCTAWAVSGDGGVVVGSSSSTAFPTSIGEGFRWTDATGMVPLGALPGTTNGTLMQGVSGDGQVVVGRDNGDGNSSTYRAVKWTQADGLVNLGTLPGTSNSRANAASYDGSVIVGYSGRAFRWTQSAGMEDLGILAGMTDSQALDVTADGSVIVGNGNDATGTGRSWIWDAANGMRDFQDLLVSENGLGDALTGWDLSGSPGFPAISVSDDGQSFAGTSINPIGLREAWYVSLAPTDPGAPTVDAGPHSTIAITAAADLDVTVTDNNGGDAPTVEWSVVSGPGAVNFADAMAVDTTATFGAVGVYELRLTATDGLLVGSDAVYVTVNPLSVDLTAIADTYISNASKDANKNFGAATTLRIDGNPDQAALLRWDLSSIPVGSVVQSATLSLNVTGTSGDTYEFYEVLRGWSETQATWTKATTTPNVNWGTAGAQGAADRGTIVLGSMNALTMGPRTISLNADGIAAVQRWVNTPLANNGLVIQDYANATNDDLVLSSNHASNSAENRPRLIVVYAPPPAAPSSVVVAARSRTAAGEMLVQRATAVAKSPRVGRAMARPPVDANRLASTVTAASRAASVDHVLSRLTATRGRRLPVSIVVDFD